MLDARRKRTGPNRAYGSAWPDAIDFDNKSLAGERQEHGLPPTITIRS
jgi:hypothetical protein